MHNEEVCISYKPQILFLDEVERKKSLKSIWGFDCTCSRCLAPLANAHLLNICEGNWNEDDFFEMNSLYGKNKQLLS